jgi:hypothetical protein
MAKKIPTSDVYKNAGLLRKVWIMIEWILKLRIYCMSPKKGDIVVVRGLPRGTYMNTSIVGELNMHAMKHGYVIIFLADMMDIRAERPMLAEEDRGTGTGKTGVHVGVPDE